METNKKKKHADFQDAYKRSSNFNKADDPEDFKIAGDGKLKIEKDEKIKNQSDKEKIEETFNKLNKEEE